MNDKIIFITYNKKRKNKKIYRIKNDCIFSMGKKVIIGIFDNKISPYYEITFSYGKKNRTVKISENTYFNILKQLKTSGDNVHK